MTSPITKNRDLMSDSVLLFIY